MTRTEQALERARVLMPCLRRIVDGGCPADCGTCWRTDQIAREIDRTGDEQDRGSQYDHTGDAP